MKLKRRNVFIVVFLLCIIYASICVTLLNKLRNVEKQQGDLPSLLSGNYRCQCHGFGPQSFVPEDSKLVPRPPMSYNCSQKLSAPHRTGNIEMYNVTSEMRIDYPSYLWTHNGWIQQMDVDYDVHRWDSEPLVVHFVPFSHNDPTWRDTLSSYYSSYTKKNLDLTLEELTNNKNLTFIWAEVIFLQRWYDELDAVQQRDFKKLLQERRFEIVTGGWLMVDEAITHYAAMLDQLMEGHQWLKSKLDYMPRNGWAIDPFGHSPTMAYLLRQSGITSMVIQRAHYAIKKHLAFRQELEFSWVPASGAAGDIFCHLTPYMLYSIPYSCGPDINVCCQFDFSRKKCWKGGDYVNAQRVTSENVARMAGELVSQLRKKAEFFRHNHLLFMFGDDFRFYERSEWTEQFGNMRKIFDFINADQQLNMQIRFSTLDDYMDAVRNDTVFQQSVPSLSGDFLLYSDRSDQYWSGFFSSRPTLKNLARRLQTHLRSAEILFSLLIGNSGRHRGWLKGGDGADELVPSWRTSLVELRRDLASLQHHDAITGTAAASVVTSYLNTIKASLERCRSVIEQLTSVMTYGTSAAIGLLSLLEKQISSQHAPTMPIVDISSSEEGKSETVVFFNPLPQRRTEVVYVAVSSVNIEVSDSFGNKIPCQLNPVLDRENFVLADNFEVYFEVTVAPLATAVYHLKSLPAGTGTGCRLADVTIFSQRHIHHLRSDFPVKWNSENSLISIATSRLIVNLCSCSHLMQSVVRRPEMIPYKAHMEIMTYSTGKFLNPFSDKSGAYIFLPDGAAKELPYDHPTTVVVSGDVMSKVTSWLTPVVSQTVAIYNTSGFQNSAVYIKNNVSLNLLKRNNTEIVMKLSTGVASGNEFFTDVNGFQIHRRKTQSRLPIQGNFQPMTTAAFVEDASTRATLLSAQSHGVASLESGCLEVVLDRRLGQDDWRGLGEAVVDNLPAASDFVLLFEPIHRPKPAPFSTVGYSSILAHHLSDSLNNPIIPLLRKSTFPPGMAALPVPTPQPFQSSVVSFPCDVKLVNLRSSASSLPLNGSMEMFLILHRIAADCDASPVADVGCPTFSEMTISSLFDGFVVNSVGETSLTGVSMSKNLDSSSLLVIPPGEIRTWKVSVQYFR